LYKSRDFRVHSSLYRPRREADHLPPSSAEIKEGVELYFHSSSMP